jgi:mediator of RNA polymerase II transcription subunit 5
LFAERLESYRTKTLIILEPIDKKAQKAGAEIDKIIDSAFTLGMDNIPVVEIPTMNSRAGLYVYLNSLVGSVHLSWCLFANELVASWTTYG